jgi:hypothetical protein
VTLVTIYSIVTVIELRLADRHAIVARPCNACTSARHGKSDPKIDKFIKYVKCDQDNWQIHERRHTCMYMYIPFWRPLSCARQLTRTMPT